MTVRHFVLSAAAAFLALAIGVVLGARVLSGPMVYGLEGDRGNLKEQVAKLTEEQKHLTENLDAADDFDSQMSSRIVHEVLAGKSVVVFRTPDADDGDVEALSRLIGEAGGAVTGIIGLTDEFVDSTTAEKLRSVVNSPIVPAGAELNSALLDPAAQAGDLLGIALLINRDDTITPADDAARDTVLVTLRDTGFLTYQDRPGAANTAVIVTGGALAQDAGNRGSTVAHFAAALAPHGSGTVLAGRDGSAAGGAAVAVARADSALAGAMTTVDDIGSAAGQVTTVLALQALAGGAPPGKYGVSPSADAVTVPDR